MREEILQKARESNVKFIRLQFTDVLGMIKNVAIPVSQLEKALENEIMFDGSSIEGFVRIEESDMNLHPDPSTFTVFPWRPKENAVARMICDVYTPSGQPFAGDPRYILRRVLEKAASMGFSVQTGPECEFFLFKQENSIPTLITHDEAGYFDMAPIDHGEDARREIVLALEDMGFEVEASHHEVAEGQHEIDFKYGDALLSADRVATLKLVTRTIAARHNLHATFMPKPVFGINGSGMHTHISLFQDGKNAFYDPNGPYQLSQVAHQFIAGVLAHAHAFTAITNPLINSYKRLVPGYEAPCYVSWSAMNRSAMVRIPAGRKSATRAEVRSPDPSCNPYLAFAVMIAAGLDGIERELTPPSSRNRNIYEMGPAEREREGITSLPGSLSEALEALRKDSVILSTLGDHVVQGFLRAKEAELEAFRTTVHTWETDRYLGRY